MVVARSLPVPPMALEPISVRFSILAPSVKVTLERTVSVPPPLDSVTVSLVLSTV
jgi:hypothetical protein